MPVPQNTPPQSFTDRAQSSLLDFVEQTVRTGFEEFGRASSNLPEFLAGPTPASPAALPLYGITRAACRTYARGGGPQNLPGFDGAWSGLCKPYLESIGEYPGEGTLAPPFEGGQCFGVTYSFNFTYDDDDGSRVSLAVVSQGRIIGTYRGPVNVSQRTVVGFERQTSVGGPITRVNSGAVAAATTPNSRIENIVPISSGVVDDCGNPPVLYEPPVVPPGLPPLTPTPIDFPGIGPVNIGVDFGPDGDINIDFPDLGVGVDVADPFGGEGGESAPPSPGDPAPPVNTGAGGTSEGEAGEGEELVGLLVEVLEAGVNPNTFQNVVDTVYRGIGYVRMGYPGRLGTDVSGGAVISPQFFHAQQRGLTSWAVRANLGFNLRTTPYYRSNA